MVRPALTEGPYFVDEKLERSDIRSDTNSGAVQDGTQFALGFAVSKVSVNDPSGSTVGQNFLRGYQVADANGGAAFTTIYPGWYSGRTVHIHFKIRTDPSAGSGLELTSQLFFDESVSAEVYAQAPYAGRGLQETSNARDGIYGQVGGQLLLTPTRAGAGYATVFDIGVVA